MFLPNQQNSQEIHLTCLAEHGKSILLIRGGNYLDEASHDNIIYFGLPRFVLAFGVDTEEFIMREFKEQFGHDVKKLQLIRAENYMQGPSTQVINLIYKITVKKQGKGDYGRHLFVRKEKLQDYAFPDEIEFIQSLLD